MFTGIVEELGELRSIETRPGEAAVLRIAGPKVASDAAAGDSIAVNGVCLTVVEPDAAGFAAEVMKETLDRTALGDLSAGAPVNLERAVTMSTRLGGHLMQGHVDGVGTVRSRQPAPHWELVEVELPVPLLRYVAEKGSIALDGVSLTIAALGADSCTVSLIPATLAATTLGRRGPGERVNVEVDVLAKYVERLLPAAAGSGEGMTERALLARNEPGSTRGEGMTPS